MAAAVAVAAVGFVAATPESARAVPAQEFLVATGAGPGGGPHVKLFKANGAQEIASFFAFDPAFRGGVNVALGDLDGDGTSEIIVAAGPGGGPHVRVFDLSGHPIDKWSFFAYGASFSGGVHVAVADVNGDGDDEIVTAPGAGGGPHVRVWDIVNDAPAVVAQTMAYDPAFTGGVFVSGIFLNAASDEQGILTSPGPGGGPHVRVFSSTLQPTAGFFAYDSAFTGGVSVAAFDENGDGVDEIVTGALEGRGHVRTFASNGTPGDIGFYAWEAAVNTGVAVATMDGAIDGPFLGAPFRAGTPPCSVDEQPPNCPHRADYFRGFGQDGVFTIQAAPYGLSWQGGISVAGGFNIVDVTPPTTTTSTSTTTSTTIT